MNLHLNPIRKYGLTSPYGPVLFACAVFLFAWLIPSQIYTRYIEEPDRMFLDPVTAIFFFLCAGAFLLGLRFHRMSHPSAWTVSLPKLRSISPILYLGIPLALGMIYCTIDLIQVGAKVNFLALLLARQGQNIKQLQKAGVSFSEGIWVHAPTVLSGVLCWYLLRVNQLRLGIAIRLLCMVAWFAGLALAGLTDTATVDRTHLMSMLAGSVLIFIFSREARGRLRFGRIALYGIVSISALAALFVLLSLLRGNLAGNLVISNVLGYSITGYNRMASLLHGQMHYAYGGRGVYLFYYLHNAYSLNQVLHYQSALHWPSLMVLFDSEFSSVALAGLVDRYNLAGVFGFLYADLGWGAPIYLFFAGILTGYTWCAFRKGTALGVSCYPWIACWILFWNGSNVLFDGNFVQLFELGLLLLLWDRALSSRVGEQALDRARVTVPPLSEGQLFARGSVSR